MRAATPSMLASKTSSKKRIATYQRRGGGGRHVRAVAAAKAAGWPALSEKLCTSIKRFVRACDMTAGVGCLLQAWLDTRAAEKAALAEGWGTRL